MGKTLETEKPVGVWREMMRPYMLAVFSLVKGHHLYPRLQLTHQLPAQPPSTDTTRMKSSGASMLTQTQVFSGKWGFLKGGMLPESLSLVSSGPPWAASYNELMNARIQNESVHHLNERMLYFAKAWRLS